MSRLAIPATIEDAPEASRPQLAAIQKQMGRIPNIFWMFATSPSAFDGYLGLSGALAKGALAPPLRERIALAVAEVNGCDYCLAAHSFIGRNVAKLSEEEILKARSGRSGDARADAALRFAVALATAGGAIDATTVAEARAAGLNDAELVEIVAHIALNTLTNYVNLAFDTPLDFPQTLPLAA
ncbi:carboxymuconolactone decarboxylase family protein [Novosphingobium sp.]|uniref:carboxymuconolactone decarboxylase family protein n=1 Tax=Novosphingobium sp. TaxID=1874826 RepID=UPI0038BB3C9D